MPQLLAAWRGTYKNEKNDKGQDRQDDRHFVLDDATWEALKLEIKGSNAMVPSQFAPYVNPIDRKRFWTAETYSYFLMFLGPIVMRDRLPAPYYKHFVSLAECTKLMVKLDILEEDIQRLERDLVQWVKDFEKLYYKWDMKYISSCTASIHSLLHVAGCIRKQGPPSKYWCFAMERYGGWVKRWAKSNRKQVIVAMTNRIVKEERIYQLATLCDSAELRESNAWWDRMRGKTSSYIASYSERPASAADYVPGHLFDCIDTDIQLDEKLAKAVKAYLVAREYTDEAWQSGHSAQVTEAMIQDISFTAWRVYRSDSDAGAQRYRVSPNNGAVQANYRDASWITCTQVIDRGAHTRRPIAEWVPRKAWGQLQCFLTFNWKGEDISVAVIQAHKTENWIRGIPHPPQELGPRDGALLQLVTLDALDAIAGRMNQVRNGHPKTVIFETSGGMLSGRD